jgi:hypothetical protein
MRNLCCSADWGFNKLSNPAIMGNNSVLRRARLITWLCTADDRPKVSKDSFTVTTIPAMLAGTDIATKILIYGAWHVLQLET